jgi:aminoglycoside phosphotransferase (APT) family kinase protein
MTAEMEPAWAALFERRQVTRALPSYSARNAGQVVDSLERFFANERPSATVGNVARMGGGASKEQFRFTLSENGNSEAFVLRMDPQAGITETSRAREYELINAMQGVVPAPKPMWLDPDGSQFGLPAMIMNMVSGVAKPSDAGVKVTGLGTWLGDPLRGKLGPQFIDAMVRIHGFDWRSAKLETFQVPNADLKQAARWALNFWKAMWAFDTTEEPPLIALAEQWMSDNLPDCDELVMTHGDYRTGNFLYDEETAKITAILDWELARIGDFHEDLAWMLTEVFASNDNGLLRAGDLYTYDDLIAAYEQASGRTVNRKTLHFYNVMASYKCYVICVANGLAVAKAQHNHQDVLLTFLSTTGPMFSADLCRLLSKGDVQ